MNSEDRRKTVVCGIDPGLGITGYAVVQSGRSGPALLDAGACFFDRNLPLPRRLVEIERDLASILARNQPRVVAVEELYSHYKHPKTAILMGHARGVILLVAARLGIEVRDYGATRVKRYLTGNGHATKAQIQRVVQITLGLRELPEPPDVADAVAIALCCMADLEQAKPTEVMG